MEILDKENKFEINITDESAKKLVELKGIFRVSGNDKMVSELIDMVYDYYFNNEKDTEEVLRGVEMLSNKLVREIEREAFEPIHFDIDGKPYPNLKLKGLNDTVKALESHVKIIKSSRQYIEPVEREKLKLKEVELNNRAIDVKLRIKDLELRGLMAQAAIKNKS